MSTILKPVITAMAVLIAVTMILTRTDVVTNHWSNDELDYALRTATQDATAVMFDNDYMFGMDEEVSDFTVDLEKASNQFKESFFDNIGSTITENVVNEMNVSLSGFAGYRYIYAVYGTGQSTIPYGYTYYADNKMYEFTLGDKVFVTDLTTMDESELNIKDLNEHYFDSELTNENFRIVTIMTSINKFLNLFYSDNANIIAHNAGTGLEFNLGAVDYSVDDATVMEKMSSIIDGPSFFAVVDAYDTHTECMYRLFSLGAAELKYVS